jgi:hypothetical protein
MSGPQNLKDRIWVGDRILEVPALAPGERLVPVAELSELLVISPAAQQAAAEAVERAAQAFVQLGSASDASISALCCATTRFSSTVMPGNSRMFWKVRATRASLATRKFNSRSRKNARPSGCDRRSRPALGL